MDQALREQIKPLKVRYFRDEHRNLVGVFLTKKLDDNFAVAGFSCAHTNDRFDKENGIKLALERLEKEPIKADISICKTSHEITETFMKELDLHYRRKLSPRAREDVSYYLLQASLRK
jgi:hypothetical protein